MRGIRGMVEKEAYCTDILTQVSAVQAALNAFSRELLGSHVKTCVVQDIQAGRTEVVDDLLNILQKLMK
ncbi:Copper-sensing transcriptional repressor CsoR [anaerobic digester metagenome]